MPSRMVLLQNAINLWGDKIRQLLLKVLHFSYIFSFNIHLFW